MLFYWEIYAKFWFTCHWYALRMAGPTYSRNIFPFTRLLKILICIIFTVKKKREDFILLFCSVSSNKFFYYWFWVQLPIIIHAAIHYVQLFLASSSIKPFTYQHIQCKYKYIYIYKYLREDRTKLKPEIIYIKNCERFNYS